MPLQPGTTNSVTPSTTVKTSTVAGTWSTSPQTSGLQPSTPATEISSFVEFPPIISAVELKKHVRPETCAAFSRLLLKILELDFINYDDDIEDKEFKNFTRILIAKTIDVNVESLPTSNENNAKVDDLSELIVTIKSDLYIKENSPMVLITCFLTSVLEKGSYDSRHRVLLRHCSALLGISWDNVETVEDQLVMCLYDEYPESNAKTISKGQGAEKTIREKSAKAKRIKRYMLVGASAGIGGILVGLTGGLAAPLVAASVGIFAGAGVASGLASTIGVAALSSLFGAAGAGLTGYKMHKRVGAVEEFNIESLREGKCLHCVLCVSGWVDESNDDNAFKVQWRHLDLSREQYTLRYESKYLIEMGQAVDYLMSFAVSYAIQHTLMETALAGLMTAFTWPLVLLSSANVIDNPWNVCVTRSAEVGEQLADALLMRSHGNRPITLIGFSMGARVIYHCLLTMSKKGLKARGIVQDVVLLGAPVSASPKQWQQICAVIGGRIINGYCKTDWLLRFVYRTMSVQFAIAGTSSVELKDEHKILNFDLSHIVKGHMDYAKKLTTILNEVGIKVSPLSESSFNDLHAYTVKQEKLEEEDKKKD